MTKDELINAWSQWLLDNTNSYHFFTITTSFASAALSRHEHHWSIEYRNRVVNKFNKRVAKRVHDPIHSACFYDLFRYEFDEKSLLSRNTQGPSPHHIHGVLGVPLDRLDRVWNLEENTLDQTLAKDLRTAKGVKDVLVESLDLNRVQHWLAYIIKSKSINPPI
jgi:hypothetical protein